VGVMAVLIASIFSMPLAYFTSRFEFKGAVIIQRMGIIPLIMPPFIGAVAMLMLFGRNGGVNLLFDQWFGFTIPFMEGLNGVRENSAWDRQIESKAGKNMNNTLHKFRIDSAVGVRLEGINLS